MTRVQINKQNLKFEGILNNIFLRIYDLNYRNGNDQN